MEFSFLYMVLVLYGFMMGWLMGGSQGYKAGFTLKDRIDSQLKEMEVSDNED